MTDITVPAAPAASGRFARILEFVGLCRTLAFYGEVRRMPKSLVSRLGVSQD